MTRDRARVSLEVLASERALVVAALGGHEQRFACDDCPRATDCHFAFDTYNLDGDCLDSK